MNYIYLQFLLLILVIAYTNSESCDVYGELREVKEGRKNSPQVCDYDNSGSLNWYQICDNGWDIDDADVWCKQLGYIEAENKGKSVKKPGNNRNTVKMNNFNCNPDTDKKLVDCSNVKQTNKCDYVTDIKCKRCDSDIQCIGVGSCNIGSGICKCSNNSTCGVGMMCKEERCECIRSSCQTCQQECQNDGICQNDGTCECVGLYYGDSCQDKLCTNECPDNSFCVTVGECVVTVIPTTEPKTTLVEIPITTTKQSIATITTERPTTMLSTKAHITTLPIVLPTVTTKLLEVTNSDHSTTKPEKEVPNTPEQDSRPGLTLMEKLILSISISAGLACIIITCIAVLSICFISNIRKKRKRVLMKENEYEEMAALPSCSFHESANCSDNISISSPIEYDSVVEEVMSYSTIDSVSEFVNATNQAPYYSTVRESIPVDEVAVEELPYYSTVGEIIPAISIEEPAPYYSTVGENNLDSEAVNTEVQAPYYSTAGDISTGNEPGIYESIEFGYRDYENVNENNPIEPYLIT
ncbi:hypothetical protein LOD99_441 [Oopsacas minuta]|uniref:Uncharacterized protein n=1 Tax=Oopsacas minuta TaxID=111878 RepID=A0AAV7K8S0_9METZ|nr:hypothetical protein LOD99_441 [Oopsacas minuta]